METDEKAPGVEEKVEKKEKKISQKEFEKRVVDLGKEGLTAEKIGEKLRGEGIHSKDYDKKISQILGEGYTNPDLKNVEANLGRIEKHFKTNKQDKRAMREKDRVFAQLRKLKKYHNVQ